MQSVVAMLQRVCIKNRVQVSTYLSSLSPTGALPPSTMLTAMREFKHVSEVCIACDETDVQRYENNGR